MKLWKGVGKQKEFVAKFAKKIAKHDVEAIKRKKVVKPKEFVAKV